MSPHRSIHQKIIFDAVLIMLAAVLLALAWPSASVPVARERPPVFLGVYIIYLGVLFLLSYFYSETSYVLRALRWVAARHLRIVCCLRVDRVGAMNRVPNLAAAVHAPIRVSLRWRHLGRRATEQRRWANLK